MSLHYTNSIGKFESHVGWYFIFILFFDILNRDKIKFEQQALTLIKFLN